MKTGILLMAFGKPQYAQMAYNLAFSIKAFSPDAPICLVHDKALDGVIHGKRWVFDQLIQIDPKHVTDPKTGKFSPGRAKVHMDLYAPFDTTIYLDVDGICLKPVDDLFKAVEALKGYYYAQSAEWMTHDAVCPMHNLKRDGIHFPQMQWALPEKIWEVHKLADDAEVSAINSSFQVIRKTKESAKFFEQVRDNVDNGMKPGEFSLLWGGTYPDELAYNIACAQMKINPSARINPIWFQFIKPLRDVNAMIEKYWFLGLYGGVGTTHISAWEYYDRLLHKLHRDKGMQHEYKSHFLYKVKHQASSKVLKRDN